MFTPRARGVQQERGEHAERAREHGVGPDERDRVADVAQVDGGEDHVRAKGGAREAEPAALGDDAAIDDALMMRKTRKKRSVTEQPDSPVR